MSDSDEPKLGSLRAQFNPIERAQIAGLKKVVKEQEIEIASHKKRHNLDKHMASVSTPKAIRTRTSKKKRNVAVQLHLSDTHSAEIVTPKESGGYEHNPEIGMDRMRSVMDQTIERMKQISKHDEIQHFTVWGGGDYMVNADLHYKMERCVFDEPLVEMEFVYQILHRELGRLWDKVPCDSNSFVGSFSNHGRDSPKIIPGLEASRSYDTAIYRRLEQDFSDVKFDIAETPYTVEQVGDFKTMYTHGHAGKSGVKRNTEGIMQPQWQFIREKRNLHGLHAWAQGHYHTRSIIWADRFCHMQNASLVGPNGYATSTGFEPEEPSQNMAVVDLDRNVIDRVETLFVE